MKFINKKLWIPAVTALLLATACNKKLDVNPKQSIDAATAITTPEDVNSAVVGAYSIMAGGALYGTNLFMLADLQAGSPAAGSTSAARYATWGGTFQGFRQVYRKEMNRDNSEAARVWIAGYRAINMANIVLQSLGVVTDADQKSQYEGEALFIRGAMHFELVRYYGLPWDATTANNQVGVVIKTVATKNEAEASVSSPRNTVAEVYAQVITDLTAAAAKLPEENGTRITRYTALAMLSRVYLQQGDYANAFDATNEVIESGYYKLNASVGAVFSNKNTAESIWEIQQNDQNNAGTSNDGMATFLANLPGIGRGDFRIPSGFVNTYPAGDLRRIEWYYIGTGTRPGLTFTSKYKSFSQNLPVIRLAEMYLTRAECTIRLGLTGSPTPAEDLAMVRNPIRTNSITAANPTLADVLAERLLEMAYEGLRIHDIKRLRLSVETVNGVIPWNDDVLVFPIPQREVDATQGVITQNPGY
ncbi:RagB/SusD family nutrient uptake outer membrane protein [soil metagenome]